MGQRRAAATAKSYSLPRLRGGTHVTRVGRDVTYVASKVASYDVRT